jgi:hypothetical protein
LIVLDVLELIGRSSGAFEARVAVCLEYIKNFLPLVFFLLGFWFIRIGMVGKFACKISNIDYVNA